MPDAVPSSFEAGFYVSRYDDLASLSADAARAHYEQCGRSEGRIASPLAVREALLERPMLAASALEIGPFCAPVLQGEHVRYLDVLDAEQLRARAREHGLDTAGCPVKIHHTDGLGAISERFEAVVSCHAIEHQPDFVAHLNEVAALLEPGGLYYVIVPDKRFCFDHFIAETTIAGLVAAHVAPKDRHALASVIEHLALTTHNDPLRHWRGDHGKPLDPDDAMRVAAALTLYGDGEGDYIDVHARYFTPDSFRTNVELLFRLGLSRLRALAVYDTPRDRHEFCAILGVAP